MPTPLAFKPASMLSPGQVAEARSSLREMPRLWSRRVSAAFIVGASAGLWITILALLAL